MFVLCLLNKLRFLSGEYIGFIPHLIGDLKDVVVLTRNPEPAALLVNQARRFARAVTSPLEFKNNALQRSLGMGRTPQDLWVELSSDCC
jgi:hypothetical protein